ncbi:hypothetical protein PENNAL_c0296G06010, partial [Penicillium nalgiovense]
YLKLRAPASILQKKTPFEILYGKPPSLLHLPRIGSRAWVLIPKEHRAKLGPRSSECRLLGYYEPNQYKLYEIHSGKTVFSRDVEFDERTPVAPLIEGETGNDLPDNAPPSPVFSPVVPPPSSALPTPPASPLPPSNEREETPSDREEIPPVVSPSQQETGLTSDLGYSIYDRRRRPSRRLLESLGKVYSAGTLNTGLARQVDPAVFHETVSGPDQLEWWAATQKEYASLLEHGTWEKVLREDVPAGDHVIGCKWVFKSKANGTRKARLVIKGYRQKHGIDYHETFAAVSRMDSVRCIIASAVLRGWKLHQFDAVTAFLHGDVDSFIYMELSEGFEEPGYVCRLRRSLYGLKQAPRICCNRTTKLPYSDCFATSKPRSLIVSPTAVQLIGYTDADFGGSIVTDGAYSTSGYVFQLAGAPVSCSSKRQGEVAMSTTHAEYIGQYNAILHM